MAMMYKKEKQRREGKRTLRMGASPSRFNCAKISFCQGAGEEKFGDETPAAMLAASRRAPSYFNSIRSYGLDGIIKP